MTFFKRTLTTLTLLLSFFLPQMGYAQESPNSQEGIALPEFDYIQYLPQSKDPQIIKIFERFLRETELTHLNIYEKVTPLYKEHLSNMNSQTKSHVQKLIKKHMMEMIKEKYPDDPYLQKKPEEQKAIQESGKEFFAISKERTRELEESINNLLQELKSIFAEYDLIAFQAEERQFLERLESDPKIAELLKTIKKLTTDDLTKNSEVITLHIEEVKSSAEQILKGSFPELSRLTKEVRVLLASNLAQTANIDSFSDITKTLSTLESKIESHIKDSAKQRIVVNFEETFKDSKEGSEGFNAALTNRREVDPVYQLIQKPLLKEPFGVMGTVLSTSKIFFQQYRENFEKAVELWSALQEAQNPIFEEKLRQLESERAAQKEALDGKVNFEIKLEGNSIKRVEFSINLTPNYQYSHELPPFLNDGVLSDFLIQNGTHLSNDEHSYKIQKWLEATYSSIDDAIFSNVADEVKSGSTPEEALKKGNPLESKGLQDIEHLAQEKIATLTPGELWSISHFLALRANRIKTFDLLDVKTDKMKGYLNQLMARLQTLSKLFGDREKSARGFLEIHGKVERARVDLANFNNGSGLAQFERALEKMEMDLQKFETFRSEAQALTPAISKELKRLLEEVRDFKYSFGDTKELNYSLDRFMPGGSAALCRQLLVGQ